jgi:hypothetical protein
VNLGGPSEGCVVLMFGQGEAPKCAKRMLCLALPVSAMSTPLGVVSLVEGIVMVTWGSPWRSSSCGVLRHGRFA